VSVLTKAGIDRDLAPPLAPADHPIDFAHLGRMTLGDRKLEREVLELFDRQVDMLMARLTGGDPAAAAGAAHTLKGSAQGIGAWSVASAAAAVEAAAHTRQSSELARAVSRLAAATDETRVAIARLLQACPSQAEVD
jgi:HPt (histidine-containing phosphotransfer) domain-containing protein